MSQYPLYSVSLHGCHNVGVVDLSPSDGKSFQKRQQMTGDGRRIVCHLKSVNKKADLRDERRLGYWSGKGARPGQDRQVLAQHLSADPQCRAGLLASPDSIERGIVEWGFGDIRIHQDVRIEEYSLTFPTRHRCPLAAEKDLPATTRRE